MAVVISMNNPSRFFVRHFFLVLVLVMGCRLTHAQVPVMDVEPVVKETKTENRQKLYRSLVNSINKNLSFSLSDTTEENWMDAFYSMELLQYSSPFTTGKLAQAFIGIERRSGDFQHALMECVYDYYPDFFLKEVKFLFDTTANAKCFAICAEYLLQRNKNDAAVIAKIVQHRNQFPDNPVLSALWFNVLYKTQPQPALKDMLQQPFFHNATVVFSFQRPNRNYPGIAVIRDSAGNFLKDTLGNLFSVVQLARSINNLPGYISNGNTPQGIFRMKGFDVSKSTFIGPTPNIQLTMPGETRIAHFFNDSTRTDSIWTIDEYRNLLPKSWKTYTPFYQSYFAGMAGRTEIIAHGTTVDPSYYKGKSYYPLTPTLGCLCTKELWSEADGKRTVSDQLQLINALKRAGGADGYYIVIELNDEQRPVDINDVLPYLK